MGTPSDMHKQEPEEAPTNCSERVCWPQPEVRAANSNSKCKSNSKTNSKPTNQRNAQTTALQMSPPLRLVATVLSLWLLVCLPLYSAAFDGRRSAALGPQESAAAAAAADKQTREPNGAGQIGSQRMIMMTKGKFVCQSVVIQ